MEKKKNLRRYLLLSLAIFVLSLLCGAGAMAESTVEIRYGGELNYNNSNSVVALVNQERTSAGLNTLTQNGELQNLAMIRAMEIALYYSHTRPDGSRGLDIMGTSGTRAENIAVGYTTSSAVMEGWMNSSGHKANILDSRMKQIGVGCFYANGTWWWVQLFRSSTSTSGTVQSGSANKAIAVKALPSLLDLYVIQSGTSFSKNPVITLTAGETGSVVAVNNNAGSNGRILSLYAFSPGLSWSCSAGLSVTTSTQTVGAYVQGQSCGAHNLTLTCGTRSFSSGVTVEHNPEDGTSCTKDVKCRICGTVLEKMSGHSAPWSSEACTGYTSCTKCGQSIPPVGHRPRMDSATCTTSNRCIVCGAVVEDALGHDYAGGDCQTQQTCTRCGNSCGPFGDHQWTAWTTGITYRRRTCSVCGWVDTERISSGTSSGGSTGSSTGTSSGSSTGSLTGGTSVSAQKKVTAVKITGKTTVLTGKKISLTASVSPSNASNKAVTWSVSNQKYATISSEGVLTAKSAGAGKTVIVTATAKDGSGKKAVFSVKIKGAVSKITLKGSKTLKVGRKTTIKATVKVGKGGSKAVVWSSSNKKYARVSSKGVVKALKAGKGKTVTITAKAKDGSGKKASIKIKLK